MIENLTLPTIVRIAQMPPQLQDAFTILSQDLNDASTGFEIQKALEKFDLAVAN